MCVMVIDMDLLQKILTCNEEEVGIIIDEAIKAANAESEKVEKLGFLNYGKSNFLFKGFIPLDTRIKYASMNIEDYGMQTTDFFYDFAAFVRKYNINSKGALIYNLEYFINAYFGFEVLNDREDIFNTHAFQTTKTDEEYFEALRNNKIGDLKKKNAAQCTERSAVAQQILSLFGTESYYCMGCFRLGDKEEGHCYNIVKRKDDYAIVDYSVPVTSYNQDGKVRMYYPFIGLLTEEEFIDFTSKGLVKIFENYCYVNKSEKKVLDSKRSYVAGKYEFEKEPSKNR